MGQYQRQQSKAEQSGGKGQEVELPVGQDCFTCCCLVQKHTLKAIDVVIRTWLAQTGWLFGSAFLEKLVVPAHCFLRFHSTGRALPSQLSS